MGFTDILQQWGQNCSTFTVNTAVDDVAIDPAVDVGSLEKSPLLNKWPKGDNFIMLSFGFVLPYHFVLSQHGTGGSYEPPGVLFEARRTTFADEVTLPIFQDGIVNVPFGNYEMSVGQYVDATVINDDFIIRANFRLNMPRVSMIGVAASLDTQVFNVPFFIKVLHNQALTL